MRRASTAALCAGLIACGAPGSDGPALDEAVRRQLYERTEGVFDSGMLWKPPSAPGRSDGLDLAPLLVQEVGAGPPAPAPPEVYLHVGSASIRGERHEQRTYLWAAGHAATAQGLRITLGRDGFPALFEVLADSSAGRLIFVSQTLEEAAAGEFGDPLAGRRFAVERAVDEAPGVVVAGIVEPGPMPLGPFVYLARESRDVAAVICRCAASRVETIVESVEYRLQPVEAAHRAGLALPPWLDRPASAIPLLRWPAGGF